MTSSLRPIVAAGLFSAITLTLGCWNSGPARAVVHGKVSYKGQPVNEGTIRFIIDNRPTAQGQISKGLYRIDHDGGVPVGSGKVEIDAFEDTKKAAFTSIDGKKVMEARQILPAKYNEKSELKVEITSGENEKNFDLTP